MIHCPPLLAATLALPLCLAAAGPGLCDDVPGQPPSGQVLELVEILAERQPGSGETWLIVRVLAPGIGAPGFDPEQAQADMDWACAHWGLDAARDRADPPAQIVVQFMDRPVPRGETDRQATQFFAGYATQTGSCTWEVF